MPKPTQPGPTTVDGDQTETDVNVPAVVFTGLTGTLEITPRPTLRYYKNTTNSITNLKILPMYIGGTNGIFDSTSHAYFNLSSTTTSIITLDTSKIGSEYTPKRSYAFNYRFITYNDTFIDGNIYTTSEAYVDKDKIVLQLPNINNFAYIQGNVFIYNSI